MACCDVYKRYLKKTAGIVQTYVWEDTAGLLAVLHV